MKFLLKQWVGLLAAPLAIACLAALLALLLRQLRFRRTAAGFGFFAAVVAYLGSLPLVANALLDPLESRYPRNPIVRDPAAIAAVVVLGSSYAPAPDLPVTAALDEDGLARIVEGVRLVLQFPDAKLVASGGAFEGDSTPAEGYARLARELGVPAERIVVLDKALDTRGEAYALNKLLGSRPFLLVTSAYHMPRAMLLLAREGANPIPAPTGHSTVGRAGPRFELKQLVPNGIGVRRTERALHEYAGLTAIALGID